MIHAKDYNFSFHSYMLRLLASVLRNIFFDCGNFITELPFSKPEPPLFLERFEEEKVPEKGTLRLLARVTGNPTPKISWLRYVKLRTIS